MQIKGNKKYILFGIIILLFVILVGSLSIILVGDELENKQIEYSDVVVSNKYVNNDTEHYYVIVDEKGELYDILNVADNDDMYNNLTIGKKYRLVIQKPLPTDDKYIHIIQVFNESH